MYMYCNHVPLCTDVPRRSISIQYITVLNTASLLYQYESTSGRDVVRIPSHHRHLRKTWRDFVRAPCSQQQGCRAHAAEAGHTRSSVAPRPRGCRHQGHMLCQNICPSKRRIERARQPPLQRGRRHAPGTEVKFSSLGSTQKEGSYFGEKTETPRSRKYRVKAATCCSPTGASAPKTCPRHSHEGHARENIHDQIRRPGKQEWTTRRFF